MKFTALPPFSPTFTYKLIKGIIINLGVPKNPWRCMEKCSLINKIKKEKQKKTKIFGDPQKFCKVSNQDWIKHFNTQ